VTEPLSCDPTTEAGRLLLGLDMGPQEAYWTNLGAREMRAAICAIEAEARATPTPDTKPDVEALRMALTTIAQPGCEASRWADEFPPVPDRCLDPNYIEDFDAESGERCAPCLALAVLDTTREETP